MSTSDTTTLPSGEASQQHRYHELRTSRHFSAVVRANRAYLDAALPDAGAAGAGTRWSLTCLPATSPAGTQRRLSIVNMRAMETFVLTEHPFVPAPDVLGLLNVRESVLISGLGSLSGLDGLGLHHRSGSDRSAGDDQITLHGTADALVAALADGRVAAAARALAGDLIASGTVYGTYHNPYLAEAVLHGSR